MKRASIFLSTCGILIFVSSAHAYLDPGSGSMVLQVITFFSKKPEAQYWSILQVKLDESIDILVAESTNSLKDFSFAIKPLQLATS